jgi:hypothetical protein
MEQAMSMFAEFLPLLDPKFLMQIFRLVCREFGSTALGRRLGGMIILSMRLGALIMPAFRPAVTEAMHRVSHGSSDALAPRLGLISIVCTVLYGVPPASILAAIVVAFCLDAAQVWPARSGGMLSVCIPLGICVALLVCGGPWWRERNLRLRPAFRRRRCCIEH